MADTVQSREWAVQMRSISRRFDTVTGSVLALDDVDVDVASGRFTVIAGPSGSGKSTLLAIAGCFDRADSGSVVIDSDDVQKLGKAERRTFRGRSLGLILPVPADNLLGSLDAGANLRWSARRRSGVLLDDSAVAEQLAVVGLEGSAGKRVPELSGGEQQRLALLCALVGGPRVVLADEPTASLDRASSERVIAALRAASDRGVTLMVASHDSHVLAAADVVIHLDYGRRVA